MTSSTWPLTWSNADVTSCRTWIRVSGCVDLYISFINPGKFGTVRNATPTKLWLIAYGFYQWERGWTYIYQLRNVHHVLTFSWCTTGGRYKSLWKLQLEVTQWVTSRCQNTEYESQKMIFRPRLEHPSVISTNWVHIYNVPSHIQVCYNVVIHVQVKYYQLLLALELSYPVHSGTNSSPYVSKYNLACAPIHYGVQQVHVEEQSVAVLRLPSHSREANPYC